MSGLIEMLSETLASGSVLVYALVFAGGVVASFTPCTYPVIPLTVGYIGNQAGGRRRAAFLMSLALVVGMALAYAVLGMIFAAVGMQFGEVWGSGWALFAIAIFFMMMGLFLLDVFSFPVPQRLNSLRSKVTAEHRGVAGAFLVGGVSALIVGPCTGPILAVIIGVVVTTMGESSGLGYVAAVLGGGLKLFLFGLGQGALILLAGTFTGFLSKMPRSGAWLATVKKAFALLVMLAASLLLVYVGQNTDFPDLSGLLASAERGSVEAPLEPGLGEADDGGKVDFGGDEFLD